jgi:hypothetical protein
MSYGDRQALLVKQWPNAIDEGDQFRITPFVSYAKNYTANFADLFKRLKPEDEGVVLKNPKLPLKACFKSDSNWGWQVKCRIPHKNYSF